MSWKIYLIIISNAHNINIGEVPQKIGLDNVVPKIEISINEAQDAKGTSIGKYNDKLFIIGKGMILYCFDKTPSAFEKRLCDSFPNSEIAILLFNGTVDVYGYNIIKDGKRQRVKIGDLDKTYVDYGDKLPEEVLISKEGIFDDDELKELKAKNTKKQFKRIIDQSIGVKTTFSLTKRYFNKQFDESGSDYEKIRVTLYD